MFDLKIAFLLLLPLVMSTFVAGQCCDVPPIHILSNEMVLISTKEVWTTDVFVNGTLVVDDELMITGAEVVMGGAGISVTENGTLILTDSRVSPHPNNTGFYLENRGRLELNGAVLEGCSDPGNSLIGLYLVSSSLIMDDSMMISSGLIHCQSSSVRIRDSSISGLVSSESDCTLKGGNVTSMGLTQYGKGKMEVMDVDVTSSISFSSPISAISSLDGGELVLEDVRIEGSYDGGIYARNGVLSVSRVSISLQDGLYGLRSENTSVVLLDEMEIDGTLEGMTLLGTDSDVVARNCIVHANYTGLLYGGMGTLTAYTSKFQGSTYGAIVKGPTILERIIFEDNLIGIMAEEGSLKKVERCIFTDFEKWGIEEEAWSIRIWPDNSFEPGQEAKGTYAWWGRVNVSARSEEGFEVEGAELKLGTMGEVPVRISAGEVGMVWGYSNDGDTVAAPLINVSARWGTSSAFRTARPMEMVVHSLVLTLRLSDISVTDIRMIDHTLEVDVAVRGPGVRDVRATIYVDGSYRTSELFDLGPNGTVTLSFTLRGLDGGERNFTASVLSRDEYSGADGALTANNEMSITFMVKVDKDSDVLYVPLALCIMFVSIAFVVIVGYVKKSGPKV
ncbi:MAG: hypothetical protein MUC62_01765 [Candidatus Thermoplasmatota archaeon]|jgi:hypothetical protein|nr:hypothetical protein [Candidatus Thermoplasmatota archaeon]